MRADKSDDFPLPTCPTTATNDFFFTERSTLLMVGISKLSSQVKEASWDSMTFSVFLGFLPMDLVSISPALKKSLSLLMETVAWITCTMKKGI